MSDPNKDGLEEVEILPNARKINKLTASGSPLDSLEQNKYVVTKPLKYPSDLKTERFPHYIKFNINQPATSRYKQSTLFDPNSLNSVVDRNKKINTQLGGGNINETGTRGAITGALVGGIWAFNEALSDLASQAKNADSDKLRGDAAGLGFGAAGIGVVTAIFTSNIDLSRKTKRLLQTIELYIPDQVIMQSQNKYGEVSLTAALGMAGLAAQAGAEISQKFNEYTNVSNLDLGSAAGQGKNPDPFTRETVSSAVGGALSKLGVVGEDFARVALQSSGYAQNPQIEVLFETTDVRQFEFTFNFLPRNKAEADEVNQIIRMFRFHSAPEIPSEFGGRFFVPPSEFDIEYMFRDGNGNESQNQSLHKFSTCVLESISVNYVGASGQFSTFKDGTPVNIEMVLRFKELEVIHKDLIKAGY